MGDNGAALLRGKGTLYKRGLHVPLLARYPEMIAPGTVSDILVSGSDIALTMLDVAGVAPDEEMTGKSFRHAMEGDETENHDCLFAVRGPHGQFLPKDIQDFTVDFDLSRAAFNKSYWLIYNPLFPLPYSPVDFFDSDMWHELVQLHARGDLDEKFSETYIFTDQRPMYEFYDLNSDPYMMKDRYGDPDYAEAQHDLMARLHRWMIIYQDPMPLPIEPPTRNQ
jgi:arylsulfatase A-like enzyme